jgi:hypothetical protein
MRFPLTLTEDGVTEIEMTGSVAAGAVADETRPTTIKRDAANTTQSDRRPERDDIKLVLSVDVAEMP